MRGEVNSGARGYAPRHGAVRGKRMTVGEGVKMLGLRVVGVGGMMMPGIALVAIGAR